MADNILDATAPAQTPAKDFTPKISLEPDAPEATQHVLDVKNKTVVKVPLSQVPVLVGSGQYALPDSGSQYVVDSYGELGQVPNSKYAEALKSGQFLPASEQEIKKAQYDQKFGNSEGLAALAGAARGATFGFSDQLLTKGLGVEKGTLAGLQEANPASSIAGEIGGVVASSFIPGTLVARAAKGAVVAGNVAGKAALAGLQKMALKAGVSNSVAQSIVSKVVPALAGSAVEGGLYGAGQLISENALGKADFNAENLASYAGTGALFGAGVGAVLGAGAAILPGAKSVLKSTVGKEVDNFVSKEKNAFELLGIKGAKLEKELKRNPNLGKEVVDALMDETKIGPTALKAGDDALVKKISEMKETAGNTIGTVMKQVDEAAALTPGTLPKAADVYAKLANHIDDSLLAPLKMGKSGEFNPARIAEAKAMQATAESFKELAGKASGDISMTELHGLMKQFDAGARFDKFAAVDPVKIALNKELRYVVRNELDDLAEKVSGELKTTLKTANKDYYIAAKLGDYLEHKIATSGSPVSLKDLALAAVGMGTGDIGAAAGLVGAKQLLDSNLRRRFVIMGGIEKANMYADKLINNSVTNFFKSSAGPVKKAAVGQLVDFSLSTDDAGRKPKNDTQAYYNLMQNVDRYAANPDVLVEKLNRRTAQIYDEAPETAAALDMVGQRAVMFLSSKLPRKESMPGMLKRPYQPSNLEMAKFKRYVGVVEDPLSAVKNLENGTMTADEAEALKVVYPNIFERLQNKVIEHVSDNANIPYSRKLQLGILMDVATDASLLPQNVLGLQNTFQSEAGNDQQNQGVVKPSQKGLQSLDFASRVEGKDKE